MENLNKLRELRAEKVAKAREILERAEKTENRAMNSEEKTQYDSFFGEVDALKARIESIEKIESEERAIQTTQAVNVITGEGSENRDKEKAAAFSKYLRNGSGSLNAVEKRDLSVGDDTDGGYTVAPSQFTAQLIQAVKNLTPIFDASTIFTLTQAKSLDFPKETTQMAAAAWTAEAAVATADSTVQTGLLSLVPGALSKLIKVSKTLLREASFDIEAYVRGEFAYLFGAAFESAIMTGDGTTNNQPVGIFNTTHADVIPTSRDKAFTSATAVDADALKAALYHLKVPYRVRASWLFNRSVVAEIAKLKDDQNRYLWSAGLEGAEDTLLGRPVLESEYAPNTLTTGLYVGALADFSNYYVAMRLPAEVQRLNELYAGANQVGFVGRMEATGKPKIGEAFVRLKMG